MYRFILFFLLFVGIASICEPLDSAVYARGRIPVMASHTIRSGHESLVNYKNLEEAGFTLSRENYPSREIAVMHLKIAEQTGVKLIVGCPEILSDTKNTVAIFNSYKSFAGYYLSDEPGANSFEDLSAKMKKIRAFDDSHYIWVNLFPMYATKKQLQTSSYERYVDGFLETVKPRFVSFDNYGILKKGLRSNFYHNLEIVSSICREADIPFWAYVLTSQFGNYEYPTKGTLSFQAYCNLAYGAQGIEYFSYRRILDYGLNMTVAPIDTNYQKMPIFDDVKNLNKEIEYYSKYFYQNTVKGVYHLSKDMDEGVKRLRELAKGIRVLSYSGKGFVVSTFTSKNRRYILFVNKDWEKEQTITIESKGYLRRISYFPEERTWGLSGKFNFNVQPGSIVLLRIS